MLISVVIPLYNEVESLRPLHEKLTENLQALDHEYEIIYVDDGSTDGSFQVLEEIHAQDKHTKVVQFRRNFGKSAGMAAGFAEVSGEIVFTLDADLQDDPEEIPRFLEKLGEGYDFVSGRKFPRHDPLSKTLPSKLANGAIRLTTGVKVQDMNSGFKAMRREVADELNLYGDMHRYVPVLVHWRGFRIAEINVKHHPRQYGKSKYGIGRLSRGLFDFVTIIFLTQFNRRPLHFFGWFGLASFALGFIINVYLSVLWLMGVTIGNRPLLTLGTLLIIIGVQFFSFGLLAEMVNYEAYSREKNYTIRKKLE